jgi:hypothetical protein
MTRASTSGSPATADGRIVRQARFHGPGVDPSRGVAISWDFACQGARSNLLYPVMDT